MTDAPRGGALNPLESFCVSGEAGEQLEAELNAAGPGSCTFVSCDISKEAEIQVSRVLVLTPDALLSF